MPPARANNYQPVPTRLYGPLTHEALKDLQDWYVEWHRRLQREPKPWLRGKNILLPLGLPPDPMPETAIEKETRRMERIMS